MFGAASNDSRMIETFRIMADPNLMLSNAGIRSLSASDQLYKVGSNYWRGAVWINVNYLLLRGLYKNYLTLLPPAPLTETGIVNVADLYHKIRLNLIEAVYSNWQKDHLFWEQYDDKSKKGQITHPFTGWTTLIVLIVSERYV